MTTSRSQTGAARVPLVVFCALVVATWAGIVRLAVAFLRLELHWAYVAEQSRRGAPWPYRLAGVWGGMDGSLLLFGAIVATAVLVAVRSAPAVVRWAGLVTAVALVAACLALASPFRRLAVPSAQGFGLNPILEHPMMAIHPPLLYCGLAAAAGAAFAAAGRDERWPRARGWMLWCVGLLTIAMTLGGAWSYVEQGWGGYWAWDPVENSSLIVWLAALVALHLAPLAGSGRLRAGALAAPWVLGLFGAALVRSGRTPSVHGFAEQREIGLALFLLALATALAAAVDIRAVGRRHAGDVPNASTDPRRVAVALLAAATLMVVVGTAYPVVSEAFGATISAVRGEFFARTVGPLAAVMVPFVALQLRRSRRWSRVGHAGVLLLIVGVGVSAFDRHDTISVGPGATQRAAGVEVVNDGIAVLPGSRIGTDEVVADLRVDGRPMMPRLVVHRERGGRLAEIAVHTGWRTDTHAVLDDAFDNGTAVVTVHRRHGMWLVWSGTALIALGAIASHLDRRGGRSGAVLAAALAGEQAAHGAGSVAR